MNKLRGRIREVCGTEGKFAEAMGLTRASISMKLNGKRDFTVAQIAKACEILGIEAKDAPVYFLRNVG